MFESRLKDIKHLLADLLLSIEPSYFYVSSGYIKIVEYGFVDPFSSFTTFAQVFSSLIIILFPFFYAYFSLIRDCSNAYRFSIVELVLNRLSKE